MRLGKYHGLGNDFLVALAADNPGLEVDAEMARAVCDRHRGVGADGLIFGLAPRDPRHDAAMVLLNSDGSEAEISGNGIRCLTQALIRRDDRAVLTIETPGGDRDLHVVDGEAGGQLRVDVDMGEGRPGPKLTAISAAYPAAAAVTVDIGNPHLVLEVEDPAAVDIGVDGPALEAGYPNGINVNFVTVRSPQHIDLRVWERGAGVTEACGSGAVAAVIAATGWGAVQGVVEVEMPGGTAGVELREGRAHLIGPSVFVADVVLP